MRNPDCRVSIETTIIRDVVGRPRRDGVVASLQAHSPLVARQRAYSQLGRHAEPMPRKSQGVE